jgi:hypothetical protein
MPSGIEGVGWLFNDSFAEERHPQDHPAMRLILCWLLLGCFDVLVQMVHLREPCGYFE